jgi:hypothetical protein
MNLMFNIKDLRYSRPMYIGDMFSYLLDEYTHIVKPG